MNKSEQAERKRIKKEQRKWDRTCDECKELIKLDIQQKLWNVLIKDGWMLSLWETIGMLEDLKGQYMRINYEDLYGGEEK